MKIQVPLRENIDQPSNADPIKSYYFWGTKEFFLHRLRMSLNMLGPKKYQKMLDIGFGSGIFIPELSRRCNHLYGIDVHNNVDMVEDMLRKEGLKATLSKASATEIPYPSDYFDCVVCVSVLEHIRDIKCAVGEIRRVVKEDGTIVLGFPVDNKLTYLALKISYLWLPNASLEDEHVCSHIDILEELSNQLKIEKTCSFPSFVPINYSLYFTCKCRKTCL